MESIRRDDVRIPNNTTRQISPEMFEVLMALLNKDPRDRITLPQLIQHPWLNHA